MITQAIATSKPPSRGALRRLWANGWGARLILIGSLLSFPSLFASWGIVVHGAGWSEYHYRDGRGGPTSVLPHPGATWGENVGANTVDDGSEFDLDPTSAWFFAALMALSVYVASKPLGPDRGAIRWVPIACTAVLVFSGVTTVVKLVNETQSYMVGAPSGLWAAQGMGPFLLIACQVLAGLGGLLFLRGRPAPSA